MGIIAFNADSLYHAINSNVGSVFSFLKGFSRGTERVATLSKFNQMSAVAIGRALLQQIDSEGETRGTLAVYTDVQVATVSCTPRRGELKLLGLPPNNHSLRSCANHAFTYVRNHVHLISSRLGRPLRLDPETLLRYDVNGKPIKNGEVDVLIYFPASCTQCKTCGCAAPLVLALCSVFWRLPLPVKGMASMGAIDHHGQLFPATKVRIQFVLNIKEKAIGRLFLPQRNKDQVRSILEESRVGAPHVTDKDVEQRLQGIEGFENNILDMIASVFYNVKPS